jgi:hypothetical protein
MGLALLDPSYDLVRAGGLEPPRGYPQRIFVPATAFAAPPKRSRAKAGSWSGLSLHPAPLEREHDLFRKPVPTFRDHAPPGFRCCPSSLYTFPFPGLARDCHCRFPRVWAVLHPRFPAAHSNIQVRCVCHSATPAWRPSYTGRRAGRQAERPGAAPGRKKGLDPSFPIV